MNAAFHRYLLAKRTVDDRALNQQVYAALAAHPVMQRRPLRVLEVGCGVGTMVERLLEWGLFEPLAGVSYLATDTDGAAIAEARRRVSAPPAPALEFRQADLLERNPADEPVDLLIANAVLDLLHLPTALPILRDRLRPGGLAWLTINFDGATLLEPHIDPLLDASIERTYHASMDARLTNGLPSGDSRTGRHLFSALPEFGLSILAAGASDWVVFAHQSPAGSTYPADEAHFLRHIVNTIAAETAVIAAIGPTPLAAWQQARLAQIDAGTLTYIAHQLDFLVQRQP